MIVLDSADIHEADTTNWTQHEIFFKMEFVLQAELCKLYAESKKNNWTVNGLIKCTEPHNYIFLCWSQNSKIVAVGEKKEKILVKMPQLSVNK